LVLNFNGLGRKSGVNGGQESIIVKVSQGSVRKEMVKVGTQTNTNEGKRVGCGTVETGLQFASGLFPPCNLQEAGFFTEEKFSITPQKSENRSWFNFC
jgi:hypothetical protein